MNPINELSLVVTKVVARIETTMILNALESCGWNRAAASRKLGVPYGTLLLKMRKYGPFLHGQQLVPLKMTTLSLPGINNGLWLPPANVRELFLDDIRRGNMTAEAIAEDYGQTTEFVLRVMAMELMKYIEQTRNT